MERIGIKYRELSRALKTLEEILKEPYSVIVRDATIHRFEYTFEAFWKFIKEFLRVEHGIVCNSPKGCFRELFAIGLISEEDTIVFLEMTDSRNDTVHTYREETANLIYSKIERYFIYMKKVSEKLKDYNYD